MSGVSNNQLANETTFDNAFIARNGDSNTVGKLDLDNVAAASGTAIANIQREHNSIASYVGKLVNAVKNALPTWTDASVGSGTDNLTERAEALTAEFNPTTGHNHDGTDSPYVDATTLTSVRLRGYMVRGTNLLAVSGTTKVVTTELTGKTESSGDTVKGVITSSTNNKVILRDKTSGDDILSAVGDVVYARLTKASTVWTLSFYTDIAGVETAYTMVAQDIAWYYEELFNPLTDAPIYNDLKNVPSDNATQDVVDASATQRGLVSTGAQVMGAGVKNFPDTTQSTSKDTGGVVLEGGLGVEKNINAGGAIAATGAVTGSNLSGTNTGDVANDDITNAKLANMATQTFKGRTTAGTGDPEDLTVTQATAMLNLFSSTLKGLVPLSGGGTTNFLRADGTFAAPSGSGSGTPVLNPTATKTANYTAVAGDIIPCDASGGGFTITLPACSLNSGQQILIKKIDSTANPITIARAGSDLIDGETSQVLIAPMSGVILIVGSAANWYAF